MSAGETLVFILLGSALGFAGQFARALLGIYKERRERPKAEEWFSTKELLISLAIGAVAGAFAAVTQYSPDVQITRDLLLAFAVAGYTGADFIGGVLGKLTK